MEAFKIINLVVFILSVVAIIWAITGMVKRARERSQGKLDKAKKDYSERAASMHDKHSLSFDKPVPGRLPKGSGVMAH